MKKQLFLFVLMMLPLVASADAVEINGIYYNLTAENKQAEVTSNIFYGYSGSIEIPDKVTYENVEYSVTSIGAYAFQFSGITSITIPNSVTSIGKYAFYGCSGLTSITIPNSVTSISEKAFLDCSNLTSVTISSNVMLIYDGTFQRCKNLTSITIPKNLGYIGSEAFRDCSGLTSITVEEGNSTYDSRDNCNAIIRTSTNELVLGCQNTIIPQSVTSIGSNAFYGCKGLTFVTIPSSITTIKNHAFYGCSGLTSFTIPNSVTSIGSSAFHSSGLTSVTIPNSVTSIGSQAFVNNYNLSVVISLIENPFSISYVFYGKTLDNATLYVPVGTKESYMATAGWKDFAHIEEGDPTGIKVIENIQNKNTTIYDLNGVRQPEPKKGINIVNGKKIIMK